MKVFRVVLIVACFSLICALFSGVASALEQNEATVTLIWSNTAPYQGSVATVRVSFKSDYAEVLTVYYVGLHFDWMDSDTFVGPDLSDNPVIISGYGSYTFDPISVLIPENASVGTHSYFVGIDGLEGDSTGFSWDSPTQTLQIQTYEVEIYNTLRANVASNITEAANRTYQSSEAQSLFEQAESAYAQALSLANEENWGDAIAALQSAYTYLDQANMEEQNYVEAESQQNQLLIIVGVVAVVAVVAVLTIILLFRRKKKETAPVNQPT
jgi:hypothetical protein